MTKKWPVKEEHIWYGFQAIKRTCQRNRGWALVLALVAVCALTNRREVNSVWEGDKIDVLEIIVSAKISASNFGVLTFGISHAQW